MAQKNRSKEIWLIPKRVNLHQTVCLIDGIIERNYDGTSWNPQKQNNLGANLKKWGATKDGKNISPQAIRTLVASIPQYLGFLYINTESTPNTICLTEAGMSLWSRHKDEIVKVPNLCAGKELLITESKAVLQQMEKLQITNPVINKDCENIYVFPFRFMLKVLLKVGYLDQEEIAYFLFKARNEDEVDVIVQEIENFRKISTEDREVLINAFKNTHIGNITLVKASSAGYYISLCQITGIMDKLKVTPNNRAGTISALKIKNAYRKYVEEMLSLKYQDAEIYDFEDNLQLWIDYIGNPNRDYTPIDISIANKNSSSFLIQIYKDGICKYDDLIEENNILQFPMFVNEKYNVKVIDVSTGNELNTLEICPTFEQRDYEIDSKLSNVKDREETLDDVAKLVIEHCEAMNFAGETLNYLNTLLKVTGIDKTGDKSLRGAYFEYYIYKMLNILKKERVIDDVIWNGKIGKYGLPTQAPGGKTGTPDMVFTIDDTHFVVELTTIKAKALQFSAEASSVPDHIRLYKQETKKNVVGIFCAPTIHQRNTAAMKSTIAPYGIELHCVTDKEIVELLLLKDRERIKELSR
ncbi:MAG: AlwI family type II restriction endonuclease [Clostridia bacterium]|nr:AlwI family type II restriction endonuclease [Clostridia bacterium]